MPIYEYECRDCGFQLEVMRKISDEPLTGCPSCGNETLQKMISKVAFRLKGTGWYETDFKNKPGDGKTKTAEEPGAEKSGDKKDATPKDATAAASGGDGGKTPAKEKD